MAIKYKITVKAEALSPFTLERSSDGGKTWYAVGHFITRAEAEDIQRRYESEDRRR